MNATPEPIAHIDGEPQYAQATMADGSVVVASTPPAIWAEPEPEGRRMSEPDIDAQPPASAADWLEVHPEDRHPYGFEPRTAWQAQGATADTAELHLDEPEAGQ